MTQTFNISGMTCEACEYKIQHVLSQIPNVSSVIIKYSDNSIKIESLEKIDKNVIIETLKSHPKYALINDSDLPIDKNNSLLETQSNQYYPLFLIAVFITVVSFLTSFQQGIYVLENFELKMFLHNFMTGFFLVFSFFKLLDIKAFAESFQMYDLLAAKLPVYGKVYPFIELCLGILCLIHFQLYYVYIADIIIMGFGALGVIQSVLDKRKIRCACLGSVFNLPMSTITIIENSLMVLIGIILLNL
jgi:cation transport ATPase